MVIIGFFFFLGMVLHPYYCDSIILSQQTHGVNSQLCATQKLSIGIQLGCYCFDCLVVDIGHFEEGFERNALVLLVDVGIV